MYTYYVHIFICIRINCLIQLYIHIIRAYSLLSSSRSAIIALYPSATSAVSFEIRKLYHAAAPYARFIESDAFFPPSLKIFLNPLPFFFCIYMYTAEPPYRVGPRPPPFNRINSKPRRCPSYITSRPRSRPDHVSRCGRTLTPCLSYISAKCDLRVFIFFFIVIDKRFSVREMATDCCHSALNRVLYTGHLFSGHFLIFPFCKLYYYNTWAYQNRTHTTLITRSILAEI